MTNANFTTESLKRVGSTDLESKRPANKAVACYNLAVACLQTDDRIGMLRNLAELEVYLAPDMAVYKNLINSGFMFFLFKGSLINSMIVLEELLQFSITGEEPRVLDTEQAEGSPA